MIGLVNVLFYFNDTNGRRVKRLAIGIALGLVVTALNAGAQTAPALYAAASPVPNQSAAARTAAFRRNLARVLVKVSGEPAMADYAATLNAASLVTEYRYRRAPASRGGGLQLWAHFAPDRVKSVLAAAGVPIWGANRPTLVAWVTTPSGMLGSASSGALARALTATARRRGLPLVLPLLDLTDRRRVSSFDVRSFYLPALKRATQRYDAQGMLIGSIMPRALGVGSRWRLVLGGSANSFSIPAPSAASAAEAAVAKAAGLLAERFARLPARGGWTHAVALVVGNVDSLSAAVTVRRTIGGMQGVDSLHLARVNGERLHFDVSFTGTLERFSRLLELTGILARKRGASAYARPAPAAGTAAPKLLFRYTP